STSYRAEHVKTSVAADAIDRDGQVLRYFHGPGLFELSGADYRGAFRIGEPVGVALPPYTELVRFDAGERLADAALKDAAGDLLRHHLARCPSSNPFQRFAA